MLIEDLATLLAAGGPFTGGGDTFAVRTYLMPDGPSVDTVIVLSEGEGGGADIRAMGASLAAPVREQPILRVRVRSAKKKFTVARTVAETVHQLLSGYKGTLSGRQYYVKAVHPPRFLEHDRNDRIVFETNYLVQKERG